MGSEMCIRDRLIADTSSFDDTFANAKEVEIKVEELAAVVDQVEKRPQAREFLVSNC